MRQLGQRGDVSKKIGKDPPHLVELTKIILVPGQGRRAAVGSDDCDPTFEGEPQSFDALQIAPVRRERKLTTCVG